MLRYEASLLVWGLHAASRDPYFSSISLEMLTFALRVSGLEVHFDDVSLD